MTPFALVLNHLLDNSWYILISSKHNMLEDQSVFEIAGGKIVGHIDGVFLSGLSVFSYPALLGM